MGISQNTLVLASQSNRDWTSVKDFNGLSNELPNPNISDWENYDKTEDSNKFRGQKPYLLVGFSSLNCLARVVTQDTDGDFCSPEIKSYLLVPAELKSTDYVYLDIYDLCHNLWEQGSTSSQWTQLSVNPVLPGYQGEAHRLKFEDFNNTKNDINSNSLFVNKSRKSDCYYDLKASSPKGDTVDDESRFPQIGSRAGSYHLKQTIRFKFSDLKEAYFGSGGTNPITSSDKFTVKLEGREYYKFLITVEANRDGGDSDYYNNFTLKSYIADKNNTKNSLLPFLKIHKAYIATTNQFAINLTNNVYLTNWSGQSRSADFPNEDVYGYTSVSQGVGDNVNWWTVADFVINYNSQVAEENKIIFYDADVNHGNNLYATAGQGPIDVELYSRGKGSKGWTKEEITINVRGTGGNIIKTNQTKITGRNHEEDHIKMKKGNFEKDKEYRAVFKGISMRNYVQIKFPKFASSVPEKPEPEASLGFDPVTCQLFLKDVFYDVNQTRPDLRMFIREQANPSEQVQLLGRVSQSITRKNLFAWRPTAPTDLSEGKLTKLLLMAIILIKT